MPACLYFIIITVLLLIFPSKPALAQDVIITENQNSSIELGDFFTTPDGPGTATINIGVVVNDSFGDEAVIVNDADDNELWTIQNYGSLFSTDSDSVYLYTNCNIYNTGNIISESDNGVYVEFSNTSVININNNTGGKIQGSNYGVYFSLNNNGSSGQIVNRGTIKGDVGIQSVNGDTEVINYGTITGLEGEAVILGIPGDLNSYILNNYGIIAGNDDFLNLAVSFGDGNDEITLQDGSIITGGDIAAGGGNDILTVINGAKITDGGFYGEGGIDRLNLEGSGSSAVTWNVESFENINKDGTGRWSLETALDLGDEGGGSISVLNGDLGINTSISGLGSAVSVSSPGTLSGNGSIDNSINCDGMISPGNPDESPTGTLNVTGNVNFANNSSMAVDIGTGGSSDILDLTGTATVGASGTKIFVSEYTAVPDGELVNVIQSSSPVPLFAALEQDTSLIVNFTQSASGNNLGIITSRIPYLAFADSGNQSEVAETLDNSIGNCTDDMGVVLACIDFLNTEKDIRNAYEQLEPKPYAIHPDLILQSSSFYRDMINYRLAVRRKEPGLSPLFEKNTDIKSDPSELYTGIDYYSGTGGTVTATLDLPTFYGGCEFYGQCFFISREGNKAYSGYGYESTTFGALLCIDQRYNQDTFSGLFFDAEITDYVWLESRKHGKKYSLAVGGYSSIQMQKLTVEGSARGSINWLQNKRLINFDDISRTAESSYTGYGSGIQFSFLYDLVQKAVKITPLFRINYDYIYLNDFSEEEADSVNLMVSDRSVHSLGHELGLLIVYNIEKGEWMLSPGAGAGWLHEYLDTKRDITSSLSGSPENSFTVSTPHPSLNKFRWHIGLNILKSQFISGSLKYEGELEENIWNNSIWLRLSYHY